MRILIDIGHPAHVHYFKHFIRIMQLKGHEFLITARDKEITFELLKHYQIQYINRGKGGKGLLGKLVYLLKADWVLYKIAKKFKPDLFLSFASTYAAHVSWLNKKPHVAIDDTEHAKFELFLYPPFTKTILTPNCFSKDLGNKQIKFNSYTELFYLHKNHFNPNPEILKLLDLKSNEKFAIVRFVSWDASHDVGQKGLSINDKIELVNFLAKRVKVFISSEGNLPEELKKYRFNVPVYLMHDALFYASLYVGEGGTTASESALLGTPAIYINQLMMGYINDEMNVGLLFQRLSLSDIEKQITILLTKNKDEFITIKENFLNQKTDITNFLIWFIENYPKSFNKLKNDPSYEKNFI